MSSVLHRTHPHPQEKHTQTPTAQRLLYYTAHIRIHKKNRAHKCKETYHTTCLVGCLYAHFFFCATKRLLLQPGTKTGVP